MAGFSLGDLITVGCLMLDCGIGAESTVSLQPETSAIAPIREDQGVLYQGVGYSSNSPTQATNDAYASVLQTLMFETGFEINTAHQYLITANGSKSSNETHTLSLSDKTHAMNFLSRGEIRSIESSPIKGGFQTELRLFVKNKTLKDMRDWSESIREYKLGLLKAPYIIATGKAVRKNKDQSERELERIAKLRALQTLAEATTSFQRSYTTVLGDSLSEDEIRTTSYAYLENVEVVSVETKGNYVLYKVRVIKPEISEYLALSR